ncbi:hypothetical protein LCGC14_0635110 [marine sediment metagenome]|uniref:Uncharacterized protein n=1 Tax=marine sediment metagenome TaxID=412755 RepID=A0A0F9R0R1_9ZZZZ
MSKKKKTKHTFSIEEKELIQKMKRELRSMGVSRDQWSSYIQQELSMLKKSKGIRHSKFMNKVSEGFGKVVQKVASKKLGNFKDQLEEFEDLFKQGSQDEIDFINKTFSDIKFENVDDLGKNGATFKKHPQKEKIIVNLDFLDEDD